jgi:hypothetical protein
MVHVDLDAWIDKLRKCEHLEEDELKTLCEMVRQEPGRGGEQREGAAAAGATTTTLASLHPSPPSMHHFRSRRSWSRSPTSSPSTAPSR